MIAILNLCSECSRKKYCLAYRDIFQAALKHGNIVHVHECQKFEAKKPVVQKTNYPRYPD